ncbi:YHYH domain-containing protein [Nitratireductor aquibiodomus]|uniref:YHYH domain-containing protein n=1 Tax=Nitratireductor aquibiodomus TaxID=204799 RepID=UPI00351ED82B
MPHDLSRLSSFKSLGDQMKRLVSIALIGLFASIVGAQVASAHSGNTDANGCHRDHKRGGYHCH